MVKSAKVLARCTHIYVSEYHISTSCKIYYKNLPEKLLNRVHTSVPRTDAEATTQRSLATTWCFRTLFSPARRPLGQDRTFQQRIWLLTNHIASIELGPTPAASILPARHSISMVNWRLE